MGFVRVTASLPETLVKRLDKERGDIPRSKAIARIIESHFKGVS